jgi:hypothetical protein
MSSKRVNVKMTINTTDVRSNAEVQIKHAIDTIGHSEDRRRVFEEIYRGKSTGKTAEQIAIAIGIPAIRVLQEALVLSKAKLIGKKKVNKRLVYFKDDFFSLNKRKILRGVVNIANTETRKKIESKTAKVELPTQPKTRAKRSIAVKSKVIKILFLAANPTDTVSLRLDEEVREIEHKIMLAQKKDQLIMIKKGAVRASDLQLYLNQEKPTIVHFSGHGTDEGKIVLEDLLGNPVTVPPKALARVFKTLKDNIRCIVLNACFSFEQARAINQYVDFVIGMSSSIEDKAAIAFSSAFYLALSSERSIKNAFDKGINEILLMGFSEEENTPKLLCRDDIDPSEVFLLE